MERKKFIYMLEINILRNCSHKNLGVLCCGVLFMGWLAKTMVFTILKVPEWVQFYIAIFPLSSLH